MHSLPTINETEKNNSAGFQDYMHSLPTMSRNIQNDNEYWYLVINPANLN